FSRERDGVTVPRARSKRNLLFAAFDEGLAVHHHAAGGAAPIDVFGLGLLPGDDSVASLAHVPFLRIGSGALLVGGRLSSAHGVERAVDALDYVAQDAVDLSFV